MSSPVPPNILVVGAGPVGLTLACELLRHGVACRVVDKSLDRHTQSRATDIHGRTLEVFFQMGVLPAFEAKVARRGSLAIVNDGEALVEASFSDMDPRFGYPAGLCQSDTEEILLQHLADLGGSIDRGVRLADLREGRHGVTATLLHADHTWREDTYDWVVGCDGAHSAVRRALGAQFDGRTFEEGFFLADVQYKSDRSSDELAIYTSEHGIMVVLPIPGATRVFGDVPAGWPDPPDLATIQEAVRQRSAGKAEVLSLGWAALFHVHTRMVQQYRKGRVFLAGDAAHIHSPVGGHGLNLGVQDAHNLAWKLALVAEGLAKPALLDSYDAERRPMARAVLFETDLQTRGAMVRMPWVHAAMGRLVGLAMKLDPVRQRFLSHILEVDVAYPDSPLTATVHSNMLDAHLLHAADSELPSVGEWLAFSQGPAAGSMAPDVALAPGVQLWQQLFHGRHTLLLFDGLAATAAGYAQMETLANAVAAEFRAVATVVAVVPLAVVPEALAECEVLCDPEGLAHRRYGAGAECAYLVRPDGYVALRAQPLDAQAILGYLRRWYGVGASSDF